MTRFMTYHDRFPNARLTRSKSGVLEIVLHNEKQRAGVGFILNWKHETFMQYKRVRMCR